MARIWKRGKTWQYEISYKKEDGSHDKIRKAGFRTKADAKVEATEIEDKLAKGMKVSNKDVLLADHFEQWMRIYKKPFVTDRTYQKYKSNLKNIKKYFKSQTIKSLTRTTYQEILNEFAKTHADATVDRLNTHIRSSLMVLVDEGVIPYDFTKKAMVKGQTPGVPEDEKYLDYDDFKKLMQLAIKKLDPHYASRFLIVVGGATGMRIGELLGLTWDHIDLEQGIIHVVRAFDYTTTKDFCSVKNAQSVRDLLLDDKTLEIARDYRQRQEDLFAKMEIRNKNQFVFYNAKYGLISYNAALKKLKELQRQLNIDPPISLHGLRHTHASIMIYQGVDILAVSKHLGHKSLNVTMSTYSHAIKELKAREDDKIKSIMTEIYTK